MEWNFPFVVSGLQSKSFRFWSILDFGFWTRDSQPVYGGILIYEKNNGSWGYSSGARVLARHL